MLIGWILCGTYTLYIQDNLKESTWDKRDNGVQRKISSQAKLPSNWIDILWDSANKRELFAFLTCEVAGFSFLPNKKKCIPLGDCVTFTGTSSLMPKWNR